jgi:hypothetical protein
MDISIIPAGNQRETQLVTLDTPKLNTTNNFRTARTLDFKVEFSKTRKTPTPQMAEVLAKEGNNVRFRGYIDKYSIVNGIKTVNCKGIENLLAYRISPVFNYCYTTAPSLRVLLEDHVIGTQTDGVGLLFLANSYWPPGWPHTMYDVTNNIIRWDDMGTDSCIGTSRIFQLSKDGIILLTEYNELDDVVANAGSYYRNANTLLVRPPVDAKNASYYKYPFNGGLVCENALDTKIRLGTCPDINLHGALHINWMTMQSVIAKLIEVHGCTFSIRDGRFYSSMDVVELA